MIKVKLSFPKLSEIYYIKEKQKADSKFDKFLNTEKYLT